MVAADENPRHQSRRPTWAHRLASLLGIGLVGVIPGWACGSSNCPKQDDDPCTLDTCDNGTSVHTYLGDGHPCFRGSLEGTCHEGLCQIACETWKDCDDGNPCTLNECQGGKCVVANNDYATPAPDGNACTHDSCQDGTPLYWPEPDGTPCAASKGECTAGLCNLCENAADCGKNTECLTWACEQGTCVPYANAKGSLVQAGDVKGDCQQWVCDGAGNAVLELNPLDFPLSSADCFSWKCVEWTPVQEPKLHAQCIMQSGELGYCDDAGTCIQCLFDTDCKHANDRCLESVCVNCGNGIQDGDETGKDCGGSCGACNGTPCEQPTECATLNCAYTNVLSPDRVCCDYPCDGVCEQCDLGGHCVPVLTGQQDKITCADFDEACAGLQCKTKTGYPCQFNTNCISNNCDPVTKLCKSP